MRRPARPLHSAVRWLVLPLFALLVGSCGGDSTGPATGELYFRFRANGALVEFTGQTSLLGTFATTGSVSNLIVTGYDGTSNAAVQFYDSSPITTGTYTGYTLVGMSFVGVIMHYHTPGGVLFQQGSPAVVTATIDEITATRVRGTFSGTLEATGQSDLDITEGEFVVQRVN